MSVNGVTDVRFSDLLNEHKSQNLQQHAHVVNLLKTGLNPDIKSVRKETRFL